MKDKKVLILTQPIGHNYGGIMQAYALQKVVRYLGFDVVTNKGTRFQTFAGLVIRIIKRAVFKHLLNRSLPFAYTPREYEILGKNTKSFIDKHIRTTDIYKKGRRLVKSQVNIYYAIIVGSDQVWRHAYSDVRAHLLDFTEETSIKRLAYAASFGRDDIDEYGSRLVAESARLAQKFAAISVREDSGVEICKRYWGVDAVQLVDPTLLLKKPQYLQLIGSENVNIFRPINQVFAYIMDDDKNKQEVLEAVSKKLNIPAYKLSVSPPIFEEQFYADQDKYAVPPVSQWLAGFADAKFVVTDSFHGCVLSIIFNKPFIVVGNSKRGLARFNSILKLFSLEDRLVSSLDDINDDLILSRIDWKSVGKTLASERKRSLKFLKGNLS